MVYNTRNVINIKHDSGIEERVNEGYLGGGNYRLTNRSQETGNFGALPPSEMT